MVVKGTKCYIREIKINFSALQCKKSGYFYFELDYDYSTKGRIDRMRTDRAVTMMNSDRVAMRLIVNRMTDRHM